MGGKYIVGIHPLTLHRQQLYVREILQNHAFVLNTLNTPGHVDDDYELPYLYWIP